MRYEIKSRGFLPHLRHQKRRVLLNVVYGGVVQGHYHTLRNPCMSRVSFYSRPTPVPGRQGLRQRHTGAASCSRGLAVRSESWCRFFTVSYATARQRYFFFFLSGVGLTQTSLKSSSSLTSRGTPTRAAGHQTLSKEQKL